MRSTVVIIVSVIVVLLGVIVGATFLFGRTGTQKGGVGGAGLFAPAKGLDGGVYMSQDGGETWTQRSSAGPKASIGGLDINDIVFDLAPSSSRVLLATTGEGLYQSSPTGGEPWIKIVDETGGLKPDAVVQDIAMDPKTPTTVYIAATQGGLGRVLKSEDGALTFRQVYPATAPGVEVFSVAIDHEDPNRVYAGTGDGLLILSENRGASWRRIGKFDAPVRRIAIHPTDANFIYLTFLGRDLAKVRRSHDRAETWEDLKIIPPKNQRLTGIYGLAFHPTDSYILYLGTNVGVLKTEDAGATWTEFPLIVPPSALPIFAIAVNPADPNIIYVSASTRVYKSLDGGITWTGKLLPTVKNVRLLEFSPATSTVLWVGLRK